MKHLYKIILVMVLQMGFSLGGWSQKLTLAEDAVLGIHLLQERYSLRVLVN
jgi:hypothetical protein